ncbi:MAG: hypothetical protein Q8O31_03750 [Rhodocyclaceae bacterium]|nr:hypothetical protein [Rhodocyclaceae bacterium]
MNASHFALALPEEICSELARRVRERRLRFNWSINELARRAGVAAVTLRKFETTGHCRLDTFVKVLETLNALTELQDVLASSPRSIDDMRALDAVRTRKHAYRRRVSSP